MMVDLFMWLRDKDGNRKEVCSLNDFGGFAIPLMARITDLKVLWNYSTLIGQSQCSEKEY